MSIFTFGKERKYRQRLKSLYQKYTLSKQEFDDEILMYLNRLKDISTQNPQYKYAYQNLSYTYDNIKNGLDKDCNLALASFEELINDKNFDGIKEIYESNESSISSFTDAVKNLKKNFLQVYDDEIEVRNQIIPIKNSYRDIKVRVDRSLKNLKTLYNNCQLVFQGIDDKFEEFDNLVTYLKKDEAIELKKEIEILVNETIQVFSKLPSLYNTFNSVFVKQLNDIETHLNDFTKTGYPLDMNEISKTLTVIKNELKICNEKLERFEINTLDSSIYSISTILNEMNKIFIDEIEAKKQYTEQIANVKNFSFEVMRDFTKIVSSLDNYRTYYVLDKQYIDQIPELNLAIDEMLVNRDNLENATLGSIKKPYSYIIKSLKLFEQSQNKAKSQFDDFKDYFISLKSRAEYLYKEFESLTLKILQFKSLINEINLDYFYNIYNSEIDEFRYQLNVIYQSFTNPPLDLNNIESLLSNLSTSFDRIVTECRQKGEKMYIAESSLVYTNLIRRNFDSYEEDISRSESFFFNGEYDKSILMSKQILQKVYPEKGETE